MSLLGSFPSPLLGLGFLKLCLLHSKSCKDMMFDPLTPDSQTPYTFKHLRTWKLSKAERRATQTGGPRTIPPNNKRYLILTYAAEFDRVHYPLPLLYEENPDPQRLKQVRTLPGLSARQECQQTSFC